MIFSIRKSGNLLYQVDSIFPEKVCFLFSCLFEGSTKKKVEVVYFARSYESLCITSKPQVRQGNRI